MQPVFDYVLKNKEWIFSGIGVFGVSAVFLFLRMLFTRKAEPTTQTEKQPGHAPKPQQRENQGEVPSHWHGVLPENSKYEFYTETASSIPVGPQSFSFEYGPRGHTNALNLKGTLVQANIQFTCHLVQPYKAMFSADEYSLNSLQPKFLTHARIILETFSLARLRQAREEAAQDIVTRLSPQFEELGFQLDTVTIGELTKLEHAKA